MPEPPATAVCLRYWMPSTKPGELEDVLGHPLAPLAAGLAARQRLAQALGGLGELGEPVALLVAARP